MLSPVEENKLNNHPRIRILAEKSITGQKSMGKSRKKQSPKKSSPSQLQKINPHAAGIDLGAREHWVCVPSEAAEQNIR